MAELETMEVGSLGHFSSASGNMLLSPSQKRLSPALRASATTFFYFFLFGGSYTACPIISYPVTGLL